MDFIILKIVLDGKLRIDQIPSLKSNKIIDYGDEAFFKLFLDTYSKLFFEASELILPDKENITPKDIFIEYVDDLIKKSEDERRLRLLKEARKLSLAKLQDHGVE